MMRTAGLALVSAIIIGLVPAPRALGNSYYVDSVGGYDQNSGLAPNAPVQTITGLLALGPPSGSTIYIKRGSYFNGVNAPDVSRGLGWAMLNLSDLTNITVEAYGSGPRPIFDCADDLPVEGWTAYTAGGASHTWSRTLAIGHGQIGFAGAVIQGTGEEQPSVWDLSATGSETTHLFPFGIGSTYPTPAKAAAAVEAHPGSFFYDATAGVLYVHTWSGAAPGEGEVAVSMRDTGIFLGDGAIVEDMQTEHNLQNEGSLTVGLNGLVRRCAILDGGRHNLLIGSGQVDDCDLDGQGPDVQYGGYSAVAYYFQGTGAANVVNVTNCRISYGLAVDGSYAWTPAAGWNSATTSHADGGGSYDQMSISGCTITNFVTPVGNPLSPPATITLANNVFVDVPIVLEAGGSPGAPLLIQSSGNVLLETYAPNAQVNANLLRGDGPVTFSSSSDMFFCDPFYGLIWLHAAAAGSTVNVSGDTEIVSKPGVTEYLVNVDSGVKDVSVSVANSTFGGLFPAGANPDYLPASGVLFGGSGNTFDTSPTGPVFYIQPQSRVVNPGCAVTLAAGVGGNPLPSMQWYKNGTAIAGATYPALTLGNPQAADSGSYTVVATNGSGSVTSSAATVWVGLPLITAAPFNVAAYFGSNATLTVAASGAASYQWYFNGAPVAGATSPSLTLSNLTAAQAGAYTVMVANDAGPVTSAAANLILTDPPPPQSPTGAPGPTVTGPTTSSAPAATARLTNLSALAATGPGLDALSAGFSTDGSKRMLIRGIGPTLADFGVSSPLPDPVVSVYDSAGAVVATDTGWGGTAALSAAFAATSAFPLPAGSADSALLTTVPAGASTVLVTGASGDSGAALVELYDADAGTPASRLVNLSARGPVLAGHPLAAGFYVSGTGDDQLLVRGIGPSLSSFGVPGALALPVLTVYDSNQNVVGTNQGWGGGSALTTAFAQVGAFALPAGSDDSALLLTLPAGSYSAQVTGADGTSGIALVEIYEVPQ